MISLNVYMMTSQVLVGCVFFSFLFHSLFAKDESRSLYLYLFVYIYTRFPLLTKDTFCFGFGPNVFNIKTLNTHSDVHYLSLLCEVYIITSIKVLFTHCISNLSVKLSLDISDFVCLSCLTACMT